jgi:hypothetical protein
MPEADGSVSEHHHRHRRRRTKRTGLGTADVGRTVFWIMVALSLAAMAFSAHRMRLASLMAGPLQIGVPVQEVRYLRGEPQTISPDGKVWTYPEGPAAQGTVRFGADGQVEEISCIQVESVAAGCSEPMGVALGTSEDWLVNRLGPATSERYQAGGKQMVFADLGLIFEMREFKVVGIRKIRRSGKLSFLPRLAWNMLP